MSGGGIALRSWNRWIVGVAMVLILGVALFFRLYHLDTFLHWAFGDEMTYGLEGRNVVQGRYSSLFAYTWDGAPATYAYILAIAQQIFGATLHTGRMVSVVFRRPDCATAGFVRERVLKSHGTARCWRKRLLAASAGTRTSAAWSYARRRPRPS